MNHHPKMRVKMLIFSKNKNSQIKFPQGIISLRIISLEIELENNFKESLTYLHKQSLKIFTQTYQAKNLNSSENICNLKINNPCLHKAIKAKETNWCKLATYKILKCNPSWKMKTFLESRLWHQMRKLKRIEISCLMKTTLIFCIVSLKKVSQINFL